MDPLAIYRDRLPPTTVLELIRLAFGAQFDADHFDAWARQIEFDDIGGSEMRVLSELDARLGRNSFHHPLRPRIAGIHRRTLYANRLLLHRGAGMAARISAATGIDGVVVGGCARYLRGDETGLAKPFGSFDLLLPSAVDRASLQAAVAAGQQLAVERSVAGGEAIVDEFGFRYRILYRLEPFAADEIRDRATEVLQEERRIKVISVEDELFETIWRGMDARGDPHGLWLADALGIVTGGEPVQWAVLAELARRHGACQGVAAALTMIAEVIDAPPAMTAARDRLLAADESWVDRTAMRLRARPRGGIFGLSGRLVLAFLGESRRAGQTPGPRGFLTFLGRRWGTSTAGETIAAATARLKRHARRRRGTRRAP